jgi:3-oxoacyl-[acyl-carrier protein] reductase
MQTKSFKGKVALVTGGSRGIGAGIVRRLAADGASVAFTYSSSEEKALQLVSEIESTGGKALSLKADSGSAKELRAAVARTTEVFGTLDIFVSSAGILTMDTIDVYSLEDFDLMVAINVRAAFVGIQAAAQQMKEGGRIVLIGSNTATRTAFPGASVYSMTKAALAGLVRGAAIDLAPRAITVNNVQPGPTATDMSSAHAELAKTGPAMKVFQPFRLDTVNHCLWRAEERVPLTPKAFDVLRYLVEHAERLVTQDEILEALWPETYVNPEVIKQYIRGIRKALGDDPEKPVYIETFPRRGYQFIAPIAFR